MKIVHFEKPSDFNLEIWAHLTDLMGGVALWRPAYRASRMKLSRSQFTVREDERGAWASLKRRLQTRQEEREKAWTEADHHWLLRGFSLLILASLLKLLAVFFRPDA
jgi:hypothetical protein